MNSNLDSPLSQPQLLTTPKSKESTFYGADVPFELRYFYNNGVGKKIKGL